MKHTILAVCLFMLLLTGCANASETPEADSDNLQVVATFSILGDMVRNVGGSAIDLTVLVGPDGDAHSYEPPPADLVTLASTDLIFENGLGFEPWLEGLYESSASNAARVVVTQSIDPLTFPDSDEQDPHVWHDVASAIAMTEVIRDALIDADPDHASLYESNAELYLRQLQETDAYVRSQAETVRLEYRKLVTNHDTFGYFARAYGFEVVGTALGATTGETDPSAGQMADLIAEIRAAGVPTIFAENVGSADLMAQIASEADVRLGPPLYTDALGQPGTDGATYITLMRYNIEAIAGLLQ